MGQAATRTRQNRTIIVDFHDETTYYHLLGDGKAFLECVLVVCPRIDSTDLDD